MEPELIRRIADEHGAMALRRAGDLPYQRPLVHRAVQQLDRVDGRSLLLDGPRRTGKTTTLCQAMGQLADRRANRWMCYVDFTDVRLRVASLGDVVRALLHDVPTEPDPIVFLDEVHYVSDWARDLKLLIDQRRARFVAADSCAALVRAETREAGVGRWERIPVHPLTFPEWLQLRAAEGIARPPSALELSQSCAEDLHRGGFPEMATSGDLQRCHGLLREDVVQQAVRTDVGPLRGLRDPSSLEQLLVARIASSGSLPNAQEASELVGVSKSTSKHWLRALEDTGLVWRLDVFSRSPGKRERSRPKIYAVDPGLVAACSPPVFGLTDHELSGRLVETAVAQALRVFAERHDGRVSYWRDARRREIDFVLETGGRTYAIEATAGDGTKKVAEIASRSESVPADWSGVVCQRSDQTTRAVDDRKVHLVPVHALLEAIGDDRVEDIGW